MTALAEVSQRWNQLLTCVVKNNVEQTSGAYAWCSSVGRNQLGPLPSSQTPQATKPNEHETEWHTADTAFAIHAAATATAKPDIYMIMLPQGASAGRVNQRSMLWLLGFVFLATWPCAGTCIFLAPHHQDHSCWGCTGIPLCLLNDAAARGHSLVPAL